MDSNCMDEFDDFTLLSPYYLNQTVGLPFGLYTPVYKKISSPNSLGSDVLTPESDVSPSSIEKLSYESSENYEYTPKRKRLSLVRHRVQNFNEKCSSLLLEQKRYDNMSQNFTEKLSLSRNSGDEKVYLSKRKLETILEDEGSKKRRLEDQTSESSKRFKPTPNHKRRNPFTEMSSPKRVHASPMKVSPKKIIFEKGGKFSNKCLRNTKGFSLYCDSPVKDYLPTQGVDILSMLAVKNNLPLIVSNILNYLSSSELYSASLVSKNWNKLCYDDKHSAGRLNMYMSKWKSDKENVKKTVEKNLKTVPETPPIADRNRQRFVLSNNHREVTSGQPASPPISPGKKRFTMYYNEGQKLGKGERLQPCPLCSFPSRVVQETAQCVNPLCSSVYCITCNSKKTENHNCNLFVPGSPSPTKIKQPTISSKQSRKALRRL